MSKSCALEEGLPTGIGATFSISFVAVISEVKWSLSESASRRTDYYGFLTIYIQEKDTVVDGTAQDAVASETEAAARIIASCFRIWSSIRTDLGSIPNFEYPIEEGKARCDRHQP
jgi:hypothetical protein